MLIMTTIFILLSIMYPILDYFWMKRINNDKERLNKKKMYVQIIFIQWVTVGIIALYWRMTHRDFQDLGFINNLADIKDFLLGFLVSLLFALIINFIIIMNVKSIKKKLYQQLEIIEFMLPEDFKERMLFVLVALTAGFCEEVMFRGFMFYYLKELPFHIPLFVIAMITSIIFGTAHLYQGWKNVIGTGLMGFSLACLYIYFGTIWVPMIIHIIIDLRVAILPSKIKVKEAKQMDNENFGV
ncbi:CPBP family intramembrane metalloprotease [Parageobacillus toebii NBRC 107807]|uniref:Membrane protease YdiL (CAAX protease family) n=1 Tax=Parageobacillus toebii NBRC 107807 TaxID=1223503 RepID=A0A6G9J004_9BACL|nr:CPBP family intramembrane glutamic endopeptidase [Parageobacillus toebii]MBB3868691.1 membrane protease YdiL (CAAX protease family) [Parageobacillus toebii NBRC 107807]QIQ32031.1 CPBP family intramembrane metalloprotease [Parageobacillus toebii NBRC 107807]